MLLVSTSVIYILWWVWWHPTAISKC